MGYGTNGNIIVIRPAINEDVWWYKLYKPTACYGKSHEWSNHRTIFTLFSIAMLVYQDLVGWFDKKVRCELLPFFRGRYHIHHFCGVTFLSQKNQGLLALSYTIGEAILQTRWEVIHGKQWGFTNSTIVIPKQLPGNCDQQRPCGQEDEAGMQPTSKVYFFKI